MTDVDACRVVIADRDRSARQELGAVLVPIDGTEVVGEAGDLDGLLDLLDEQRPDVVLVDLDLPGIGDPDELVGPLRDVMPGLKVIVLSDDTTDAVITQTLVSGADGFVVKAWARQMLPTAVGSVARGGTFIDPMAAAVLRSAVLETPTDRYDSSDGAA